MSDETMVIVGMPVAEASEVCQGSKQYDCEICGCAVWIAPSGQTLVAAGCKVACLHCGNRLAELCGAEFIPSPGSMREAAEHFLRKRRN